MILIPFYTYICFNSFWFFYLGKKKYIQILTGKFGGPEHGKFIQFCWWSYTLIAAIVLVIYIYEYQ